MNLKIRMGILALVVLSAFFWTFLKREVPLSAPPPPLAALATPPPQRAPLAVKVNKRANKKTEFKEMAEKFDPSTSRKQSRGERLLEKGEALGGGRSVTSQ
jgi:hypothetical protein